MRALVGCVTVTVSTHSTLLHTTVVTVMMFVREGESRTGDVKLKARCTCVRVVRVVAIRKKGERKERVVGGGGGSHASHPSPLLRTQTSRLSVKEKKQFAR
jgi:hypothetical protein